MQSSVAIGYARYRGAKVNLVPIASPQQTPDIAKLSQLGLFQTCCVATKIAHITTPVSASAETTHPCPKMSGEKHQRDTARTRFELLSLVHANQISQDASTKKGIRTSRAHCSAARNLSMLSAMAESPNVNSGREVFENEEDGTMSGSVIFAPASVPIGEANAVIHLLSGGLTLK